MYIGYLQAHQQIIDYDKNLKEIYDMYLKNLTLPYKVSKHFTLESIYVCSANQGCNWKQLTFDGKITKTNYVAIHTKEQKVVNQKLINKPEAFVVMFLIGKLKYNDNESNVSFRVPKSLNVGHSIGLKWHNVNINNVDTSINVIYDVINTSSNAFNLLIQNKNKKTELKISGTSTQAVNLFPNMRNNKLEYKINNFYEIIKIIDNIIKTHDMKFEESNKKQFPKISFKPTPEYAQLATITISNFGYADTKGGKSFKDIVDTVKIFKDAIYKNNVYDKIVFDTNFKASNLKKAEKLVGCPKGKPKYDGSCPENYRPQLSKDNTLCCYKGKFTKGYARKLYTQLVDKNLEIPQVLQNTFNKYSFKKSSVKLNDSFPMYMDGKIMYKGKIQPCMLYSKIDLINIASKLNGIGLILKGSKKEICNEIEKYFNNKRI